MPNVEVSIVLPCRNERGHIESCLQGVLAQDLQEPFEVLVADGMSTDGTREYVNQLAQFDSRVRLIDNPGQITPMALNAAILAARGKIIIRMDAHTEYATDYARECVAVLRDTGADNVGGPAATRAHGYVQRAISAAFHSPFSVGGARFHNVAYEGEVDTVVYGCWYKETLERIGLFDPELVRNQDDELNLRLRRAGGRLWQSLRIKSFYSPRGSFKSLFRQYQQYGYWKVRVIQKHKLPASPRHLVPVLFVVGLLLGWLPGLVWAPWLGIYASGLSLYAGLSLLMSVRSAMTYGLDLLAILPAVFFTFHAAYGVGFLRGMVDWFMLKRRPSAAMTTLTRANTAPQKKAA
jgi:succinoglycan biosynthesis protein ExoA